jgi:AraC family transcriptional activator of pyochelin receptor
MEVIARTPTVVLFDSDVEALWVARAIMIRAWPEWPTVSVIARAVGLNSLKLKVGFKEVFGVTMYGFHVGLKMRESRSHLEKGSLSVAEVARLVGYDHTSSFCREFKKAFGYTPGEYKRISLSELYS